MSSGLLVGVSLRKLSWAAK